MRQAVADVIEFRRAVGLAIGNIPGVPGDRQLLSQSDWKVVVEEFNELRAAVCEEDIEEIADGGIDLIVTTLGLLLRCGIDPNEIWERVKVANLAKAGGPKRADGKAMKPEGWQPPDIRGALAKQVSLDAIYPERKPSTPHVTVLPNGETYEWEGK